MTRFVRRQAALILAAGLAFGAGPASAQGAGLSTATAVPINIAASPLADALNEWARQTGIAIRIQPDLVAGKTASAVSGQLTPAQALEQLLARTGLVASQQGATVVIDITRPETMLPAVSVKARAMPEASEGTGSYTGESTATATGLALSPRETPQSVSVVTQERIEDQAMNSVADALRNTTGVSLKPVDRGRNNLSVRGFDVNNFMFDGVPMATGNVGIETASTAIYDRIEVVRGATGLVSGAGDPSAAVNLVRKHADSKVFAGIVTGEVGSWNQLTGTVDVTVPLAADGTVRARFVASGSRQDAFIDLENTSNTVIYGVIDVDLGTHTRLSVGASDQRDKRNGVLWAGLPYWYTDGGRTDWDRSKTTATDWNQWDTKEQTAFASLTHTLPNRWKLGADLSYRRQHEDSKLLWMWNDPDRETGLGMIGYPYHYVAEPEQRQLSLTARGPFSLFGREHDLAAGFLHGKLTDGWTNRDGLAGELPLPDFNAWDGSFPEPEMGERYVGSRGTTTQTGLYGVARLNLSERFKAIVGARLSDWKRDEGAAAWTPAAYTLEHNNVLTPYAGLLFDIGEQFTAYASYADIFKPQTNKGADGSYLDPLQGRSYEAGLKGEFLDGKLNASAALFRIDQDNFAVQIGMNPDTGEAIYRAAQGVVSKGYELELSGELAPGWDISLGWTHYSAKDADGVDVAVDHARKQLKLFTTVALQGAWQGLSVGGGLNWEGDRPITATNPYTGEVEKVGQPAYGLVELMAKYEFNRAWSLQLNVFNAFDKTYRSGSFWWGAPYTYGEPRKFLLTTAFRF